MKYLILSMALVFSTNLKTLFDFNQNSDLQNWRIVNDVVMGGQSSGNFRLNADGYGVFSGTVSLENNGGFSSVRYQFDKLEVAKYTKVRIKLKGDGKAYQFRVKTSSGDYYSYITSFSTSGEWQEVEVAFKDLYPSFRGRKLDQPNFSGERMEEIAFLIANKKAEDFELLIDKIDLL